MTKWLKAHTKKIQFNSNPYKHGTKCELCNLNVEKNNCVNMSS